MSVKWTEEQIKTLEVRNKNVLVSAAAGSGKTAVLVERILRLVADEGIDIDRLLIVTFTEAAAGEMRERILKALEERASREPENSHISRQIAYICNAYITTIHSFCLDIVRQYFSEIDIDPSFKVGDEGELTLLKKDVMQELLEEKYAEGDRDFLNFVDNYAGKNGKSDSNTEEFILRLYEFSMSHPYPVKWLRSNILYYDIKRPLEEQPWYIFLMGEIEEILKEDLKKTEEMIELAMSEDGPFTYEEALRSDYKAISQLIEEKGYEGRQRLLKDFKHTALSRKRLPAETDEGKKQRVKAVRDGIKKDIKNLKEKYYAYTMDTVLKDMEQCKRQAEELVKLTEAFMEKYARAKQEKNIIDFDDMEHFALNILTCVDGEGNIRPTQAAMDIASDIYEIMVDEYQDSNLVQETIIKAVSGQYEGRNNIFMVGDVKQSIYKFRMAKPELFLEKYNTYLVDGSNENIRITLSKNFRSRAEVLDTANLIFSQLMTKELGGIEYDKDNALYQGAEYEDYGCKNSTELLFLDTEEKDEELDSLELEPYMAARRIKELTDGSFFIKDKLTGKKRPLKYGDIAILFRSFGERGQAYSDVLSSMGIPVKSPGGTGYFDSFEVVQTLNMLSVIDNPLQDIPLISVMKYMYSFSEEELAVIKASADTEREYFYECVTGALETVEEELGLKLKAFVNELNSFREMSVYASIRDLIEHILKATGFEYYVAAMKAGGLRRANLEMLKVKALDFENTSYSGLFNFVRYIELLKKYNIEQGEADTGGDGDYVTLLTIHKSKGLEYPVVFVAAMSKQHNKSDARSSLVMHQELGIGLRYMDRKASIKADTLIRQSIARKIDKENMAEELRIFYVALTRAKEKLIMVGSGKLEKRIEKYLHIREYKENALNTSEIFKAKDYLEWIIMCLMRHRSFSGVLRELGLAAPLGSRIFDIEGEVCFKSLKPSQAVEKKIETAWNDRESRQVYENWNTEHTYNEALKQKLLSIYSYKYPFERDRGLSAKVSVSDIKHMFMKMYDDEEESSKKLQCFATEDKSAPEFLSEKKEFSGAVRGTACHRVYELLDYKSFSGLKEEALILSEVKRQIKSMEQSGLISEEYVSLAEPEKIAGIFKTGLGDRMIRAAVKGALYREKQFVVGIPANKVKAEYSVDEMVLVQGIADAYFEEDGELVIVDYKTDSVGNILDLKARYEAQLRFYAMALEQITGKRVKEKLIYSVGLMKELAI